MPGETSRRRLGGLPPRLLALVMLGPRAGSAVTPARRHAVIDARDAVLCSWIFDHEGGAPVPFGFALVATYRDDPAGYLAALLRTARVGGGAEYRLVNRGTRVDARSAGTFMRALRADMGANLAIHRGQADPPIVAAALRAAEDAAARAEAEASAPLRLLGQSLGGGLAQLQAVALQRQDPAAPMRRFATFAASDVSRTVATRFGIAAGSLPPGLGDNWVSSRDGLTGPGALFGTPRLGEQHVVEDMRGPVLAWPGLAFHRATAWVNHCAGRPVDAEPPPHPGSAQAWLALCRGGCAVPEGWPPAA